VDYKAAGFEQRLAEACADGVDVYFDNTAGAISDAVMAASTWVRVSSFAALLGSQLGSGAQGPRVERHLLVKRARMQGS